MPVKTCFVIMPFGEKKDADGQSIDFDDIYEHLIKPPVSQLGISCLRCDEIAEAGWIHSKMFRHIYEADVAVVDITSLNPNVFYELGVRHALVSSGTILIRRKNTQIPFNIQDFQVIQYDPGHIGTIEEAKRQLKEYIQNGLSNRVTDSPVHAILNLRIGTLPKQIDRTEIFRYRIPSSQEKSICLITGDIRNVKGIDVWVNSENTNMQMARHFDRSISSVIRYCGAKKKNGAVIADTIAKELAGAVGENASVPPGEIVVTGAGELEKTHGVQKIFHAAVAIGQVGSGYNPIPDLGRCVRNALDMADTGEYQQLGLKSILFPLLGTGTARGDLESKSTDLIHAAISHLKAHPPCTIQDVYFLAWTEKDLEVCQTILSKLRKKGEVDGPVV